VDQSRGDADTTSSLSTEPGRWAARLSIIAAFVCFTLMCTIQQLTAKDELKGTVAWVYYSVSVLASSFVFLGIVAGFYGLMVGLKRKSTDTIGIAAIGLVLNLGIVGLVAWGKWLLSQVAVK
jgi:bacteriorhodopsin